MGLPQVPEEEETVDVFSSWLAASWRANAACSGMNPDLFFPERGDVLRVARAKAICFGCPVTAECLQYALDAREAGRLGQALGPGASRHSLGAP
jgi:hypothetical protein